MPDNRVVRAPGRPRDTSIDARVLAATRDLLAEQGFDATTVQAIAERSGVHASAIYRRWTTRTEIIERAVFPGFASVSVRATGDLRADLRRFIDAYLTVLGAPAARTAMPTLLASYDRTRGHASAPDKWLAVSARPQFVDILDAAPTGTVHPDTDPDDVFDVLLGAIIARIFVPTVVERARPVDRLIDQIMRLLRP